MRIGFAGFPKSGKTTVFEVVTGLSAKASARAPHLAAVAVPEKRLDRLECDFNNPKKVCAKIEYLDPNIPEAQPDEPMKPSLDGVKDASVIALVLRAFDDPNVPHVLGSPDPLRDAARLIDKMFQMDIAIIEKRVLRIDQSIQKARTEELEREREVITHCLKHLEEREPISDIDLRPEQKREISGMRFLTAKPLMAVLNVDEKDASSQRLRELSEQFRTAEPRFQSVTALSARLERELFDLEDEDRRLFMDDVGLERLADERLIRASYEATKTICFFTVGDDEVRAWPLVAGSTALQAAGTIHTDMMRGFIRAEVVNYNDYIKAGSMRDAKAQHFVRLEGKEYKVVDGDMILFRFNV